MDVCVLNSLILVRLICFMLFWGFFCCFFSDDWVSHAENCKERNSLTHHFSWVKALCCFAGWHGDITSLPSVAPCLSVHHIGMCWRSETGDTMFLETLLVFQPAVSHTWLVCVEFSSHCLVRFVWKFKIDQVSCKPAYKERNFTYHFMWVTYPMF